MSSIRKIVSTVIVGFMVLGIAQSGTEEDFSIKQYLGKWYSVGAIHPERRELAGRARMIPCEWRDVTEHEDGRVEEVYTFIFRGRPERCVGNVSLINSDLCIVYPDGPHMYNIRSFDDGKDLILFNKHNAMSSQMISRRIEASTEATEYFEQLASSSGGYAHHIDNSNCVRGADQIDDIL